MENKEIYIVVQDSAYDLESSVTIEGFVNRDDAVKRVNEIFEEDKKENPHWYDGDGYVLEKSDESFTVYEDGCYCDNHLEVNIRAITLK